MLELDRHGFGDESEPDFDTIDMILSKPEAREVNFMGGGVVINGNSCIHRSHSPHKMAVTFSDNVTEIERSISFGSIKEDLNGNPDHINLNDNPSNINLNGNPDHFNSNCNSEHNTKSYIEERAQRNEPLTERSKLDNLINKTNKGIKKINSIDIIGVKRYANTHDIMSDDGFPDDEYPMEPYRSNQNARRRGSLASVVSMASVMEVGCLTLFVTKLFERMASWK